MPEEPALTELCLEALYHLHRVLICSVEGLAAGSSPYLESLEVVTVKSVQSVCVVAYDVEDRFDLVVGAGVEVMHCPAHSVYEGAQIIVTFLKKVVFHGISLYEIILENRV